MPSGFEPCGARQVQPLPSKPCNPEGALTGRAQAGAAAAFATKDEIIAYSTFYVVISSVTIKCIIAEFITIVASDQVCLFCAVNEIVTHSAKSLQDSFSLAVNLVVTKASPDEVGLTWGVTIASVDDIISTT